MFMAAFENPPTRPEWHEAWAERASEYRRAVPALAASSECGLRRELVFCLLGGHGVTFELALSATDVVMALCPFESFWTSTELKRVLREELSEPQFDPRCKNGSLRRYRYPNRKASLLLEARDWVLENGGLSQELAAIDCEHERRAWLCDCPGIGPKSASWLLRNTGYADRLAILDVHILRAMQEAGRLPEMRLPRDYESIEAYFLAWCDELKAPASALDLFLWEWQRGDLGPSAVGL
jgi:thermostable 8-oxoguanine DNA glycosylase